MTKNFKNILINIIIVFFIYLFFKENIIFKNCLINGCLLFFKNVLPSLLPMFIITDLLMNYNFFKVLDLIYPIFKLLFKSKISFYIFFISLFCGTPANAYLISNLVKNNSLSKKDASIILTYSCFLNPLFIFNMLNNIFTLDITIKIMLFNYLINIIIVFIFRNYPYETKYFELKNNNLTLINILKKSISNSFNILINVLGIILFYLVIAEGIKYFIQNELIICIINGILEVTGGLLKLSNLNINYQFKIVLALIFISFLGLSIQTQIKNIIIDASIESKLFILLRIIVILFITSIYIITNSIIINIFGNRFYQIFF